MDPRPKGKAGRAAEARGKGKDRRPGRSTYRTGLVKRAIAEAKGTLRGAAARRASLREETLAGTAGAGSVRFAAEGACETGERTPVERDSEVPPSLAATRSGLTSAAEGTGPAVGGTPMDCDPPANRPLSAAEEEALLNSDC